ncbi:thioesterase domain-containing protein [Micromonospora sp. DT43]|uniref:thioesterase domain-containing protein n=1 Tax=Micromonospora sp. DT43 TaxID=3393440 RepID=UPI003CEE1752
MAHRPIAPGCLVTLQPGAERPPVYCFHPLSGSVAVYGGLARHLGAEQPVHGFQSTGLAAGGEPDISVAVMAERYAAAIDDETAVFLGYSMGGVLALETARAVAGIAPPLVVVIDCDPLYSSTTGEGWSILVHQTLGLDMPVAGLSALDRVDALVRVRAAASAAGVLPARFGLERLDRMLAVCAANERAAAEHTPAYYDGTVHVFRSNDHPVVPGADMWNGFAREVHLQVIDADHHSIMTARGWAAVGAGIRRLLTQVTTR